jgi:hypothetical protein
MSVIALLFPAGEAVTVFLTGDAFEPVYSAHSYVVRSLIDGAIPESIQVTVIAAPAGYCPPAPGVWKLTSPKANETYVLRCIKALRSRMMPTCACQEI